MLKIIGHKRSWGQIVKSDKISVFIMHSCWMSSSYGNRLSRPNGTYTLFLANSIFEFIIGDF